jgi:predicted RNA-binding Zn-ribbon protein involved in translation (DUF1610 family)
MDAGVLLPGLILLCLVAAVAGMATAAVAARRLPRRACPSCRYDLVAAGDVPLVCPECGRGIQLESRLRRPRLAGPGRFVAWGSLIAAIGLGVFHLRGSWLPWFRPTFRILDVARNGPWSVHLLERTEALPAGPNRRIEVRFEDRPVHVFEGFYVRAGPNELAPEPLGEPPATLWTPRVPQLKGRSPDRLPPAGAPGLLGDANGDGMLDLVIEDPSGGSGGFVTGYVLALEPGGSVRPTAILQNAVFADLGGDGHLDAIAFDPTYAYRWTDADRPDPRVILTAPSTLDGRWTIDRDRQFIPAPSPEAWRAMIEEIADAHRDAAAETDPGVPPATRPWLSPLLRQTVRLAYAGHPALARDFFEEAWPTGDTGIHDRLVVARELAAAMRESPYAAELDLAASARPGDVEDRQEVPPATLPQ